MKVRERKKEITEHKPKRELVDDIFALLKSRQQIPNDFSVSYGRVCSVLSDHRLHLYSNKAHQVIVGSEEYMEMLRDIVLKDYWYSLPEEGKEKMGVGFSDMQKVNNFYGPVFGTDKALEIFGDGLARVLAEGCTKVYYFNNQRYDYNNAGKYKIRCLLCNSDGLFYEFMCIARPVTRKGQ